MPLLQVGRLLGLFAAALPSLVFAQSDDTLSLAEALAMAREKNGDVRSATFDARASRARVDQSFTAFLPTVTPSYVWSDSHNEFVDEFGNTISSSGDSDRSELTARWRLLDLGERYYSWQSSKESAEAQRASARQTLRQVLFLTHQRYYNSLRSEELVRVAKSQVERAAKVLDQTKAQVEVGETARKDILQAEADLANARVDELTAQNRLTTSHAALKATIGWDSARPLPPLVATAAPAVFPELPSLESMIDLGMRDRADLIAFRKRTRSQRYSTLRAERESQLSLALDADWDQELSPNELENRSLTLSISIPFLDGGRSVAAAREARLSLESTKSQLVQLEREARSEIEATYQELRQNAERVRASQTALDASRLNYEAASESQRLGAGTLLDVLAAQVALVTAESNYVEAVYDYVISEVRLRLMTGQVLPGEQA